MKFFVVLYFFSSAQVHYKVNLSIYTINHSINVDKDKLFMYNDLKEAISQFILNKTNIEITHSSFKR